MTNEFLTEDNNFALENTQSILSNPSNRQLSVLGELLPTDGLSQQKNTAFSELISSSRLDADFQAPIRIEAENMALNGYGVESVNAASLEKLISLKGRGNAGTASTRFTGPAGTYNVVVGYYDENDGVAQLSMKTDGKQIDSWNLDQNLGSDYVSTGNLVERKIANVSLNESSQIEIQGQRNNGEYARVDFIDFIPVATNFEAKALANNGSLVAFPGAVGFGANAKGGRGGNVLFVTNLNDSGPGSLRTALEASGPRTVIFQTGGTIELKSGISIRNPYLTIAGQTAPGDGITIKTNGKGDFAPISINTHDVIIRHLRVRPGPGAKGSVNGDAITILGNARDVIIDHSSLSWGTDEILNGWYSAHNITVQKSIISEALHNSVHDKGSHGMGSLFGSQNKNVTLYSNLLAHNNQRNPRIHVEEKGTFQLVNNVIYNWGQISTNFAGQAQVNAIANYYKAGPSESIKNRGGISVENGAKVYVQGNIGPLRPNNSMDEGAILHLWNKVNESRVRVMTPFNAPAIKAVSAFDAYKNILEDVGATKPGWDAVDKRIINDVKNGTGKIINHPSEVGGWPNLRKGTPLADKDKDGMPDAWEIKHGLNPNNPNDRNGKINQNGYTNLERYLNSIA